MFIDYLRQNEVRVLSVTENIDSLRTLVDRGIMNAISSKNDYNKAKRRLVELNRVVDSFVAAHAENTHLLDMRRIVTSRDKLTNNIRHYTREVYRDMAVKIEEIASEIEGNIMSTFRRRLRRFRRSIKRLIASCFKDLLKRMLITLKSLTMMH